MTVSTGIITTFAGGGGFSLYNDGIDATSAYFAYPTGVAVDTSGSSINSVRKSYSQCILL